MISSPAASRFHEGCGYGVRRSVPKSGAPFGGETATPKAAASFGFIITAIQTSPHEPTN
jgi:hypothetical protein